MSFVLRYRGDISICCRAPICNRDPLNVDTRRSLILVFFLLLLFSFFAGTPETCVVISRWCNDDRGIIRGRKGTIVTDSVRQMSAKSQHLLVRISPDVIVCHVIGTSEAPVKKMLGASRAWSFFDRMYTKWGTGRKKRKKAPARSWRRREDCDTRLDHSSQSSPTFKNYADLN